MNSTALSAIIFSNSITGTNPNTSSPYTTGQTVDPNITVSGIGRGSGITGSNATDRYSASGWNSSVLDELDYFTFTLTPNGGYLIDFDSFVYTSQRSNASISSFAFRSSVDSFSSNIGTPDFDGTTISLAGIAYQDIAAPIEFRFYAWGASSGGNTFSINDFTFNGTVSPTGPVPNQWIGTGSGGTWQDTTLGKFTVNYANSLTNTVTFQGTGENVVSSGSVQAGNLAFSSTGYDLSGAVTLGVGGVSVSTGTATISAALSGSAGMAKSGAGTLILSGSNDYSGTTSIASGGALRASNSSALGTTGSGNTTTVTSGGALELSGNISVAEAITLNGTGISSAGALRNASGSNTVTGSITLGSASSIIADTGTSLTLDVASGNAVAGSGLSLTLGGAGDVTVADAISLGSGAITKSGAGTVNLQATNSYTGGTTISGGTLNFVSGSLGTSGTITGSGGTLQYATGNTQDLLSTRGFSGATRIDTNGNNVTFTGSNNIAGTTFTKLGSGILSVDPTNTTYSGQTTISGGVLRATAANYFGASNSVISIGAATLEYAATYTSATRNLISVTETSSTISVTGSNTYQPGVISGSGAVNKTGTGTLNLLATNTFSGGLVVTEGTVALTTNNALLNAGAINVNGGTLSLGTFNDDVGAVTLTSGNITGSTGILSATSFTVESGTISARLNDASGNVNLTKTTSGTVTLSASNLYAGATTITSGSLNVTNTSGSATGQGNVLVQNTATLQGSGRVAPVNTGTIVINSGGAVAIGAIESSGTQGEILTLTPESGTITTTFEAGSTLRFDLFTNAGNNYATTTAADLLRTGGNITFQSGVKLEVNQSGTFTFANGNQWRLLDWSTLLGTAPTGNTSELILDLPALGDPGLAWDVSALYTNGSISVVPEPSRTLFLALGLLTLTLRRRR